MKTISSLFLSLVGMSAVSEGLAQCGIVQNVSWNMPDATVLNIIFEAPANVVSYQLEAFQLVAEDNFNATSASWDGPVQPGANIVTVDPSALSLAAFIDPSVNYYKLLLTLVCDDGPGEPVAFYASPFSMLNDGGLACEGGFEMPLISVPDTSIEGVESVLEFTYEAVSAADPQVYVESLSVFVDVQSTYLGDLQLELESPQGTVVDLLSFPNGLGGSTGISVLFEDGFGPVTTAANPVYLGLGVGGVVVKGLFGPSTPLSALNGEVANGTWKLRVTDHQYLDQNAVFGFCISVNTSVCVASVEGNCFFDMNANGIWDEGEAAMAGPILVSSALDNPVYALENSGHYHLCLPAGESSLTLANVPNYYAATPAFYTENIQQNDNLTGRDFALVPIPDINDLSVNIWSPNSFVTGFPAAIFVEYANVGTECVDNVQIVINAGQSQSWLWDQIVSVSGGAMMVGDEILMNIGTLCPGQSGVLELMLVISAEIPINSAASLEAIINPVAGDENAQNNFSNYHVTVVGPYDPNDKQVNTSEYSGWPGTPIEPLEYLIRFQNVGNYPAQNVVVRDTLSEFLNLMTFQLANVSHPVEIEFHGQEVRFIFNNINLPDSASNEPGSHGYIRYFVNILESEGSFTVDNTAYIYFDFNAPVVTNTVQSVFHFSNVAEMKNPTLQLFPNPADESVTIVGRKGVPVGRVELMDGVGRLVLSDVTTADRMVLELGAISPGLYVVRVFDGAAYAVARLVVY